jgi:hypothetical protein
MSEQITAWFRRVAALNDAELDKELSLINKNSLNAFARPISRIDWLPSLSLFNDFIEMRAKRSYFGNYELIKSVVDIY